MTGHSESHTSDAPKTYVQAFSTLDLNSADANMRGMKIDAIFEPSFSGTANPALWIVDSRHNRSWFEGQKHRLDAGSALFDASAYPSEAKALRAMVEGIMSRYRYWSTIRLVGCSPDMVADAWLHQLAELARVDGEVVLRHPE